MVFHVLWHLFFAELCLVKPAGGGACQITADKRVCPVSAEGFLCQKNAAACPVGYTL